MMLFAPIFKPTKFPHAHTFKRPHDLIEFVRLRVLPAPVIHDVYVLILALQEIITM